MVVICKTFSHHLFVTVHIPPPILERFNETFLFWIKTIIISNTQTTIKVMVSTVDIFYFLENNIEYKIFRIVKIATAIIKFIVPLIWNIIFGSINMSFIVFDNNQRRSPLIHKLTIGYIKKRGNHKSLRNGFTNVFNSHKIIHHKRYVFHESNHSGSTTTALGCVSLFNKK